MIHELVHPKKINVIEALRFFAALAVVFVHIPVVGIGHFGVDAFFIISGFVMMLSTRKSSHNFLKKRIIRVVPTYYIFTLGVFSLAWWAPELLNNTTSNIEHLLKSLLFIPFDKNGVGHFPILFLGWTLNYEMYFYLLFAISVKVTHHYRGHLTTSLLILIVWVSKLSDGFLSDVYGDIIVFEFSLGILLYLILYDSSVKRIFLMGGLIAAGLLSHDGELTHRFFVFGLPSLVVIYSCLKYIPNAYVAPWLITLGGASYALYLTHPYVIQIFEKITGWFDGTNFQIGLALVFALVFSVLFSLLVYKLIEAPLVDRLRKKFITYGAARNS